MTATTSGRPYTLVPLPKFGAEVHGIDLKQPVEAEVVEQIKGAVAQHRLLVFRDQGTVSGPRQVEIGRWFGEPESTFYKHPASPHPDIFRVSNDPSQGCTGVGRTGWHVDGSFMLAPFSHAIYHIWAVPAAGATSFAPLREVVAGLDPEQRCRWERLWMASDRRSCSIKPLIYSHPLTGDDTLCFHTGMVNHFIWDAGTPCERRSTPEETTVLLDEVEGVFQSQLAHLVYHHVWREGDFIISDNAALGHEAHPDTQLPPSQIGLRIMHRVTIGGTTPPTKHYTLDEAGRRTG